MQDNRIAYILEKCKHKRILDVGCVGTSVDINHERFMHRQLRSVAEELIGIDNDKERLNVLEDGGYTVYHMDAENFNIGRTFDLVFAGEIVEHLNNPGLFFSNASRHLENGGELLITTPNKNSLYMYLIQRGPHPKQREKWTRYCHNHVLWFCDETISELLKRHGFKVKEIYYTTFFTPKTWRAKIFNVLIPDKWKEDMIILAEKC
jgi:2-polyprenyl-3-methyl-5-hydroxy-6-metoxy-1,4-benzoquinol methylase